MKNYEILFDKSKNLNMQLLKIIKSIIGSKIPKKNWS